MERRFIILIGGEPVTYLKRVRYGAPALSFAGSPARYTERVAKGWLSTCSKFFQNVTMEPCE